MASPNIRFKKTQSYPTSGVNAGDVIFCTDDHTVYVATGATTKEAFYGGAVKNVTAIEDNDSNVTGLLITYMDGTSPLTVDFLATKTSLEALQTQVNTNKTDIATLKTKVSTGATSSAMGMMSAADKAKLDGIEAGANKYTLPTATDTVLGGVKVDSAMSAISTNPVQNKIAKAYADTKVSSVTSSSNAIIALENVISHAVGVGLKIDLTTPGNVTLSQGTNGLKAAVTIPSAPEYTVEALATAETGYLKTYRLKKDGSYVGASINIPKDFLVKSGSVVVGNWDAAGTTFSENASGTGKALKLVIATKDSSSDSSVIYINVKDLVDVYTAGDGISVSSDNKISIGSDAASYILVRDPEDDSGDTDLYEAINSLAGMSGVSSIGNQKGDIKLDTDASGSAGSIKFNIDSTSKAITASVRGIKGAAFYDAGSFATATQGTKADSAVQSVTGDSYVSATKSGDAVTLAATNTLKNAVTKANNSVQYNADGDAELNDNSWLIVPKVYENGDERQTEIQEDRIILGMDPDNPETALTLRSADSSNSSSTPVLLVEYADGDGLANVRVSDPLTAEDAATKSYVDDQISAVSEKLMWTTF